MKKHKNFSLYHCFCVNMKSYVWIAISLLQFFDCWALKDVKLKAPVAVKAGETLTLACEYDLERAFLYSLKWYFGDDEFYRYVPKESPPSRVFPLQGFDVDFSRSNDSVVALRDVSKELTGYYKCEVSADKPLFHTDIKSALVYVIEEPKSSPMLKVEKSKYSNTDNIKANCTSPNGFPAANITWYINGKKAKPSKYIKISTAVVKAPTNTSSLETTNSQLDVALSNKLFHFGSLNLSCETTQFDIYNSSTEKMLLEDSPQLARVLSPSSPNQNSGASLLPIYISVLNVWMVLLNIWT